MKQETPLGLRPIHTIIRILSPKPKKMGIIDGRLSPCSKSPNCVCSQDSNPKKWVAPIPFKGNPEKAFSNLKDVVTSFLGAAIVQENEDYFRAEFKTRIMGFVDDVEFLLDPDNSVIHVKSASRLGYRDFGTNKKRVLKLRELFEAK